MITRNIINIANHPVLKDVTRKAQVFRSYKEYDSNRVVLVVNIFHYKDGEEIKYFPKEVTLISDNDTRVNPATGDIIENAPKDEDGNYTPETMGEFDYLWYIVNTAKIYTEIQLEEIYISLRQDKINSKLYN